MRQMATMGKIQGHYAVMRLQESRVDLKVGGWSRERLHIDCSTNNWISVNMVGNTPKKPKWTRHEVNRTTKHISNGCLGRSWETDLPISQGRDGRQRELSSDIIFRPCQWTCKIKPAISAADLTWLQWNIAINPKNVVQMETDIMSPESVESFVRIGQKIDKIGQKNVLIWPMTQQCRGKTWGAIWASWSFGG